MLSPKLGVRSGRRENRGCPIAISADVSHPRTGRIVDGMCRNIRCLHNFEPATTDDEVREAALQFVRKVSGSTRPSRANAEAFDRAIDEIAEATRRMLDQLVTIAPPKSREVEAVKGRQRHEKRMEREVRIRTAPAAEPSAALV